jgi:hypothetical protein
LSYSVNGSDWVDINSGSAIDTGVQSDDGSGKEYNVSFDGPVLARYVKISPQAWEDHPSLRAGLLLEGPDYC